MFKKLVLSAILILALSASAWAAAMTITDTEWGTYLTGNTTATVVYNGTIYVKAIGVVPSAANNTVIFTSGNSTSCLQIIAPVVNDTKIVSFGDNGVAFKNLTVTLNTTTDVVYIYTK